MLQREAISVGHQPMPLRDTECRGNLGGAVVQGIRPCVVFPCLLSTKIASLRSQRQRGVAEIVSSLFTPRKDNPFGCRLLTIDY